MMDDSEREAKAIFIATILKTTEMICANELYPDAEEAGVDLCELGRYIKGKLALVDASKTLQEYVRENDPSVYRFEMDVEGSKEKIRQKIIKMKFGTIEELSDATGFCREDCLKTIWGWNEVTTEKGTFLYTG